jgi:hypothetical protein
MLPAGPTTSPGVSPEASSAIGATKGRKKIMIFQKTSGLISVYADSNSLDSFVTSLLKGHPYSPPILCYTV